MLADSRQPRELPFLPTLLCLWGAGWATSLVIAFLFVGRAYPTAGSPAALYALNFLLSAAVGAVVVRYMLASVVGVELSFSAILLALVAGSFVATFTQYFVFAGARPGVSTSLMFSFVPGILSALVTFWLLQNAAQRELPPPAAAAAWEPVAPTADAPYTDVVAAVRETALGLVSDVDRAEPSEVPSLVADGLAGLGAVRARIERTPPPADVPPELPLRLAAGMKQLADDLANTADRTAIGARDHGELDESAGLREVRQALAELERLGYGSSWG
jgi:hypothetical protein